MTTRMNLSNIDLTIITSITAYILSFVALNSEHVVASVSAVSGIIFCLTAIIKFIDLIIEKWNKWNPKEK
jgi:hypothetical protein